MSFEQLIGVQNPQMAFDFRVRVISEIVGIDTDALELRCRTASLPDFASERIEIPYLADKVPYPGRDASTKAIDFTFWESIDSVIVTNIVAWRQLIHNPATGIRLPKISFVGQVLTEMLDPQGNVMSTWTLHNAWPENLQQSPLDYETNAFVQYVVTFAYDWVELVTT